MRDSRTWLAGLLALLVVAPCWAGKTVTVVETFDGTLDEASWRMGTHDMIFEFGGNPDNYLRVVQTDTAEPRISTFDGLAPDFVGDYRARGVVSLGIDVNLLEVGISADDRPVSLYLYSDMGTPDDPMDDCEAVFVGSKHVPSPGTGWKSFEYRVPADSATLPPGWVVYGVCADLSPDEAWNRVITNVGRASFDFGEPGYMYFFQFWTIGFDNARITFARR